LTARGYVRRRRKFREGVQFGFVCDQRPNSAAGIAPMIEAVMQVARKPASKAFQTKAIT